MKKTNKHGFTLIELMIVVAIIGILAAVAIPAFINYMKRAKTSEATLNLKSIVEGGVSYYDTHSQVLPGTVAYTPASDPGADPIAVVDNDWDVQQWSDLGWRPHKPFLYRYSFLNSCNGDCTTVAADGTIGTAQAKGDLDADGTPSSFTRIITRTGGGMAVPQALTVTNELE